MVVVMHLDGQLALRHVASVTHLPGITVIRLKHTPTTMRAARATPR